MGPPPTPIGLHLTRVAREVSRAFDDTLAEAGGSLPVWLVLLNLKIKPRASQRELAEAVGVREATITHHLNAMKKGGLLTRRRDQGNRRIHIVETSGAGTPCSSACATPPSASTAGCGKASTSLTSDG